MKKIAISALLALSSLLSHSQNGGQSNENSVIKINFAGYAGGVNTFVITNKQNCTVSAQYQVYHSSTTVDISISANGIYTVTVAGQPNEYTSVKTKATSFCPSNSPDRGWVEANNTMTILPLRLVKFEVTRTENEKCLVSWVTAEESNIDRFEIESSKDGVNFNTSALIFPKNQPSAYSVQMQLKYDVTYFRLKAIENNGSIIYSTVSIIKKQKENGIKVYFAPDKSSIIIQSSYSTLSSFRIYDIAGRNVFAYNSVIHQGTTSINVGNMIEGIYIFVTDNNLSVKFMK